MPKVSLASKDAYETKLGIQEGAVEIIAARTEVFQFPPNKESGEQSAPFLASVLGLVKLDDNGARLDEEPNEKVLRIDKDLAKMRPGTASSRTDTDPTDEGSELGTIGNCIFTESGAKINNKSQYAVFSKSLEDCGFKTEILSEGYFEDLVGLKGHVKTVAGEKVNANGREFQANYFVFDKIWSFPYEQAAAAKGKAATKTTAAKGKNNGLAAVPAPAATAVASPAIATAEALADADEAADLTATQLLSELSNELTGEARDSKKVFSMAYSRLMKIKDRDRKLDKTVGELLKDDNWIAAKADDIGYSFEDGVFTFGTLVGA
jgi:hypothetical protein